MRIIYTTESGVQMGPGSKILIFSDHIISYNLCGKKQIGKSGTCTWYDTQRQGTCRHCLIKS